MSRVGKAVTAIGLVITSAVAVTVLGLYKMRIYLPGQTVNGKDVGLETFADVADAVFEQNHRRFIVHVNGKDYPLDSVLISDFDADNYAPTFIKWLTREPINKRVTTKINYRALEDYLEGRITECTDAAIVYDVVDGWKLIPEETGNDYDVVEIIEDLKVNELYYIDLDKYLRKPMITVDDLQPLFNEVEWLNDFRIEYTSGKFITGAQLNQFVNDYVLEVPEEYISDFVDSLRDDYNTTGGTLDFTTSNGATIQVKYNTYGKSLSVKKEIEHIQKCIDEHTSEQLRTPVLNGYDDFGNTYVEVSIEDQHLWYYKDGQLVSETDIVTGMKGRHDTPHGLFYISECIPGKYLVGDGYKTWVNKWMRLNNNGIGLHDATWRGSFGKTIYSYNGSHGCINLPYSYASDLYKEAYVGMPVVVY